jgi:transcriptional regulator with XRE-family HTH domain
VPVVSGENHTSGADPRAAYVGAQLRAARLAARKSIAEVAEQAGLTKGYLSKLERDLANVSVASLMRLCDVLDVSIGSLFQPSKGEIVRAAARPPANFWGTTRGFLLTPTGERRMQAILSEMVPGGGSGDEPYTLPVDVEFVFVLEGQLQVTIEGERVELEQGDAFTFAGSAKHAFQVDPQAARTLVLWVLSPALPATDLRA